MQRSTDGTRFSGVAEAFPVVQRSQAQALVPGAAVRPASGPPARIPDTGPAESGTGTGTGSGTGSGRVVQLAVAAPAPPVALPVQQAPATPPVASRLPAPPAPPRASAPRPAEQRPAPVTVQRTGRGGDTPTGGSPPPPGDPPPSGGHRPNSTRRDSGTGTAGAVFDARHLTDGQVDELTHRLIGPMTRLLRTELRLDRERIGKLRDPRR
ncbi:MULTISPECIES: hypothetical protein [unclassified Streptomyces]|uniref:hypothetical protein n=1 Tax=unclassified Streptomyces TaxID=2593676 RepID=UPI002DDA1566|nr:hypothetical protein [Streptomyces sp. NBC_01750]WSA99673.1 hypothetical protein OIE54_10530 [Streptomyces sp. NBC_01794]WSD35878.1 hypothetical protein OG966_30640 [Streptomyces sp. NBC_01750]